MSGNYEKVAKTPSATLFDATSGLLNIQTALQNVTTEISNGHAKQAEFYTELLAHLRTLKSNVKKQTSTILSLKSKHEKESKRDIDSFNSLLKTFMATRDQITKQPRDKPDPWIIHKTLETLSNECKQRQNLRSTASKSLISSFESFEHQLIADLVQVLHPLSTNDKFEQMAIYMTQLNAEAEWKLFTTSSGIDNIMDMSIDYTIPDSTVEVVYQGFMYRRSFTCKMHYYVLTSTGNLHEFETMDCIRHTHSWNLRHCSLIPVVDRIGVEFMLMENGVLFRHGKKYTFKDSAGDLGVWEKEIGQFVDMQLVAAENDHDDSIENANEAVGVENVKTPEPGPEVLEKVVEASVHHEEASTEIVAEPVDTTSPDHSRHETAVDQTMNETASIEKVSTHVISDKVDAVLVEEIKTEKTATLDRSKKNGGFKTLMRTLTRRRKE